MSRGECRRERRYFRFCLIASALMCELPHSRRASSVGEKRWKCARRLSMLKNPVMMIKH